MARSSKRAGFDDAGLLPLEPEDYVGHRDRLRERFLAGGGEALADYELLELILFLAIPRRDVKPIAKRLVARFGGLHGVLAAEAPQLMTVKGVGDSTAAAIKTIHAAALRFGREAIIDRPVMGSWQKVLDYCRAAMAHNENEEFRVLYLDAKNGLIHEERQQVGTVDHTPVYPREVVKRALERGASSIIMVHN
ncbi:MAG: DNA repair protein RadC, partial [Alphaproteobacteria bacterium]|nr:DNA repair protein RadC [Alphaproteobacteria bacterium]